MIVDSYGSPVLSVDSIFYGSTQGSSFGRQPIRNPGSDSASHNPFLPSLPITDQTFVVGSSQPVPINDPTSQVFVVDNIDSYGAPQGPIISVFDPPRTNFEPEIITGRPNFIQDPVFTNPQLDGHRPNFNDQASDSYGVPQGPLVTSRPPFNDPTPSFNNPSRPNFNSENPVAVVDSYGSPQAPVITGRPPFNPESTPRPDYNPPSDSYGAPQGPILTDKPTYHPTGRPNYRPRPNKGGHNILGPIASIIDAKRKAVANILHGFRAPKFFGGGSLPQFKLPFIGGFGKSKNNKRPRPPATRPSYQPSNSYGAPQPKPSYQPSRPSYRPPRKALPEFSGDPRAEDRKDFDGSEAVVFNCGDSGIIPETFVRQFIFRSPGYPDNYPDSFNCSVNIFPRKDVCALGLELVQVGIH